MVRKAFSNLKITFRILISETFIPKISFLYFKLEYLGRYFSDAKYLSILKILKAWRYRNFYYIFNEGNLVSVSFMGCWKKNSEVVEEAPLHQFKNPS